MKKQITSMLILCLLTAVRLQAQVTFIIDSLPPYTPPEDLLYIAGDFQGWNPGNPDWALSKNEAGKWFIDLEEAPAGTSIQYKFTRGDWGKVEKGEFGEEIPNRQFTFGAADTVHHIIFNWADITGGQTTAAENVHVMDEDFYMPQFNRYRRIWVYLPPDYEDTGDHYPVIYMHDGQNLFDMYTSYAGEWEVDETLNDLHGDGYRVPIVVGVDNGGGFRLEEYTPWVNGTYGGGAGGLYIDFLVETLKPYIDANYRTLPGRENTAIWGSSLGGLISHYGLLSRQDVFGKAGVYSPSYWWSDTVWTFTEETGIQDALMVRQLTGALEGGSMVEDTWEMDGLLASLGLGDGQLYTTIVPGGEHNEALWRGDFGEAYLWLFSSYASGIRSHGTRPLAVVPNPAGDRIVLPDLQGKGTQAELFSVSGGRHVLTVPVGGGQADVSGLAPGMYILQLTTIDDVYVGKFIKQ